MMKWTEYAPCLIRLQYKHKGTSYKSHFVIERCYNMLHFFLTICVGDYLLFEIWIGLFGSDGGQEEKSIVKENIKNFSIIRTY